MHLFQSEWLREAPRPVSRSYARRAYGARSSSQTSDAPADVPADACPGVLFGPEWTVLETLRAPHSSRFDRAA